MPLTRNAWLSLPLAALCTLAVTTAARADPAPRLSWSEPVRCVPDAKGRTFRVQCREGAPGARTLCLAAPSETVPWGEPLEETQGCDGALPPITMEELQRVADVVPAVAEAPPGYARSEGGDLAQVQFDLLNRLYMGVSWIPTVQRVANEPRTPLGRAEADIGISLSILNSYARSRHDIRLLEGTATFDELELRGQLFAYDYEHDKRRPTLKLTTFFGEPRLYRYRPPVGFGFRVLGIADRSPGAPDALDLEIGEAHLSMSPLRSYDLYDHLRVEAGAALGEHWNSRSGLSDGLDSGEVWIAPTGALRSRFSLGKGGLHSLAAEATYARPTLLHGASEGQGVSRFAGTFTYEGVLIAIDDQPISLRLAATGRNTSELGPSDPGFELRFAAGLRVSFWAPPRVFEPMPEMEDP